MKTLFLFTALILSSAATALTVGPISSASFSNKLFRKTSFKPTWQRYPPPDVFLNTLRQQFPLADIGLLDSNCRSLTNDNRTLLGDSEPATGRPSIDNPNSSTANWYNRCLAEYVKSEYQGISSYTYQTQADGTQIGTEDHRPLTFFNDYYSEEVVGEVKKLLGSDAYANEQMVPSRFDVDWKNLSAAAQSALVRRQVERLIGPEDIVLDLGLAASEDEFVAGVLRLISKFINTPEATTFTFLEVNQPEYLGVRRMTKIVQYLILFHDTHKE
jgi:hypothetical protein